MTRFLYHLKYILKKIYNLTFDLLSKFFSLQETSPVGTVIINSTRTDTDTDDITYSLDNNFGNKFSIDSATGEVKLNETLDYESVNSYIPLR